MTPPRRSHVLLLPLLLACACARRTFPTYPEGFREFAYIANAAGNTVTILDLVYLRPDRTLAVGVDPIALALNPARNEVYVVNAQPGQPAGSITVIDATRNTLAATIPVRRDPTSIAVDPTGQLAFLASAGSISVLDLATRRVIAQVAAAGRPSRALIAHDGRTLVVTQPATGTVSLFAVTPLTPAKSQPQHAGPPLTLRATFDGCPGASDAVILPDSSKAFIACSTADRVMSLSLAAAPDSWPAKQDPSLLTDHVLALLDVGHNPTNLTMKPDGGEVFVSNAASDSISEISTTTNEVGSTYAIGNRPAHGLVSADNSALWVSNLGAQSISLYSIDDGKFVSSLRTGLGPDALAFSADPTQNFLLACDTGSGDVAVIRTNSRLGPALLTILPAGGAPSAIVIYSPTQKP